MEWRAREDEEDIAMAISLPDTRQLSDEVIKALGLRALRGCELGFSEADVADLLGVSRDDGQPLVDGLRRRRPGRDPRRSDRPPVGPGGRSRTSRRTASRIRSTTTAPRSWASPPRCGPARPCAT